MAEIISKASSGYYVNEYKDNATIEYYNALEVASGKTGVTMKIMQIMTSPVFNISDRYIGWFTQSGYSNNYQRAYGDESKGKYFSLKAGYAKPIDKDKNLTATFQYNQDLSENGMISMAYITTGTKDHSYSWISGAEFSFGSEWSLTEGAESLTTLNAILYSKRAILNKLIGTASLAYSKVGKADSNNKVEIGLTYFFW
ncbi:MAG: hypothetical protein HOG97_05545 [Candidatus Marinimicrobia bacterium]|jgi:hypothetical protein|nr:hypothetical protein [Candidatus Neomarinimicrobiota bacterium]MBT5956209.1 hypothetical protein [Candidatus Neomarinimicrobiota bacterium]MBT6517125.1 hypothetical protein [Candidatus Neomarinimicrobiota bacterium]